LKATKREPYEGLAPIYDFVMRHVDYPEWAAYVRDLMKRFGCSPACLVDLACGTGATAAALHELGYRVSGVDGSEAMLRVAGERLACLGGAIPLFCRDLRCLEGLGPFGAAVCLYDSFNYLLEPADLDRALGQVFAILLPGSFFIFDICTEKNSLRYFRDFRDEEKGPGFCYRRHSYYDRDRRLQFNHFRLRFDGQDAELEELHVQRIYTVAEVVERVEASPFELLGAFDGFTFARGSEASERVHFALRRPR